MTKESPIYEFSLKNKEGIQTVKLFKNKLSFTIDLEEIDEELDKPILTREYGFIAKDGIKDYFIRYIQSENAYSVILKGISTGLSVGTMKAKQAEDLLDELDKWINKQI